MISLAGIELPAQTVWQEQFTSQSVQQNVVQTLGGYHKVFPKRLKNGKNITLVFGENSAWLDYEAVAKITSLSTTGDTYGLVFHNQNFNVVFSHHTPPACEFSPLFPEGLIKPNATKWHGTIKLMEV